MRALLNLGEREKSYKAPLQTWMRNNNCAGQITYGFKTLEELQRKADLYDIDLIIVSCTETFYGLVGKNKGTQQDWAGSVLWKPQPILLLAPLRQVQTMPEGRFILNHHMNKIPSIVRRKDKGEETWPWELANSSEKCDYALERLSHADFIVSDIETSRENGITSVGYTEIVGQEIGKTWVIPMLRKEVVRLHRFVREINLLPAHKVYHNGCFDSFHLCRWHAPPRNYYLDTEYMYHSWHVETKKSLAFISNLLLWDARFWKFEAVTEPFKYNAKDCINTARIFLYLLNNMPDWAWRNYSKLAPNLAPTVWCSFEGFKADREKLAPIRTAAVKRKEQLLQDLRDMSGHPEFNPNSSKQVDQWLFKILKAKRPAVRGAAKKKATSTDVKSLARVAMQHPLYARIIGTLLSYRAAAKEISTYYDARLTPGGRFLYAFNVDGTKTERFSCNASSLYAPLLEGQTKSSQDNYGTQVQNVPPYMKVALCADPGYLLIDIDKNKAEAHCTAKISKDKVFWNDLKGELDFYLALGNRLFGTNITDKKHPLRQIFKEISHSTSYMAGGDSLLDSIGPAEVFKYMQLLGFKGTPKQFADNCIAILLKKYKRRREWWNETRTFAKNFGYIDTPDGHRREVLGEVTHGVLRGLVAHQPQHLSVAGLNEAFWRLWFFVQIKSNGEFRLKGQVHDSIIAQAKEDKIEEYKQRMLEVMDIPQQVWDGELRIPLDATVSRYWKES